MALQHRQYQGANRVNIKYPETGTSGLSCVLCPRRARAGAAGDENIGAGPVAFPLV